jgi:hypothetical protein
VCGQALLLGVDLLTDRETRRAAAGHDINLGLKTQDRALVDARPRLP